MFDETRSQRAKNFIERLKHSKGKFANKNFELQDWQYNEIIKPLYGTINKDESRQYRTCLIMLARKNGKTSLAAALALYHLFADKEQGGEIYSAAVDKDQASLVFNEAANMVRSNAILSGKCKIIDSRKRIVRHKTNSFYQAIPADAASAHGYNASCIIYDEMHAAANRDLFDVLSTSMGARSQPLLLIISTAGFDRNSILYEQYSYAKKIKKKIVSDKTFLPIIYETDEADNWEDEKTWKRANPALGTFRNIDEMRGFCRKAKENPAEINTFKRLYLNQWTSQETRWLDITKWDACGHNIDTEKLRQKRCYGGLDLSSTSDLSAFVLIFEDYTLLPFFFIPIEKMRQKEKIDRVPYSLWRDQGYVFATNGNVIDYSFIEEKIKELASTYVIREISYDRWNATMIVQRLADDGMNLIPMGMGYASMNAPTKQIETLILQGKLNHGNHPVLRWNFDNVMMSQDPAGNIKPDKAKSTEKIDGIVASIMAVDRLSRNQRDFASIYESEGVKAF